MVTIRHRRTREIMLEREGSSLRGADLRGLYLEGADFRGHFMPHANLAGAVVAGADFGRASMSGVDLTGADASAGRFYFAQMNGASLRDARLIGAYLRGLDVEGAIFDGADMRGARLGGFSVGPASFRRVDLCGAVLSGPFWRCDFEGAGLTAVHLPRADLSGSSLAGADLRCVNLHGTNLSNANLAKADLRGARMNGISPVVPRGIIALWLVLWNVHYFAREFFPDSALTKWLGQAPWQSVMGGISLLALIALAVVIIAPIGAVLKGVNLAGARYDTSTRWPRGFDPAAHGASPDTALTA